MKVDHRLMLMIDYQYEITAFLSPLVNLYFWNAHNMLNNSEQYSHMSKKELIFLKHDAFIPLVCSEGI